MVSDRKIKYFAVRVEKLNREKLEKLERKYPKPKTILAELVGDGAGTLRAEDDIRRIVKAQSGYCNPAMRISDIFEGLDEIFKSVSAANEERDRIISEEMKSFSEEYRRVMDLVYLGTEAELADGIKRLESLL